MQRTILTMAAACVLLAVPGTAQQEINDTTGALRSNGVDPSPGSPFIVPLTGGVFDIEVIGLPGSPIILALGTYTQNGTTFGSLGGQIVNLDLAQQVTIIGDAINLTGLLPAAFFYLDSFGFAQYQFPAGALPANFLVGFQAVTQDPTFPFGLNITAAAEYLTSAAIAIDVVPLMTPTQPFFPRADEGIFVHTFVGGPYTFYGQTRTQMTISSNGWLRFDANATDADRFVGPTNFVLGTVGAPLPSAGAPIIAALWDDLDQSVGPGQIILTEDPLNGFVGVEWSNGDFYAGAPFGNVRATLNFSQTQPVIILDYTSFTGGQGSAIVGISDGDVGLGPDIEADLVSGGAVQPYFGAGSRTTYFQDFGGQSGAVAPEIEDLVGLTIFYQDISGNGSGQWFIF